MPKPSTIISTVASAMMNDAEQAVYDNETCLPLLNLALNELQETYELNGLPVTKETSKAIKIKAGIASIGFDTNPSLPSDLIEIQQLWTSPSGLNQWNPLDKRDTIPHYLEDGTTISQFLVWAWEHDRIRVIASNSDNDLKIDYIGKIFNTPILIKDVNVNLPFTNIETYLEYKTGALCAMFIAENLERAQSLDTLAMSALSRALGIPVKGMQNVITRRRPFRASFKDRNRGMR